MTSQLPPENLAQGLGGLVSDAFDHASKLIRGEVALAKAEVRESLGQAQRGIIMLVIAIVLAPVGLILAAMAAAAGLAELGMHPGWAMLVVGGLFLLVAGVLAMSGASALKPSDLVPNRTAKNLRRDADTIKESLKHDKPI
jgi:membrane protein YqaA with SNARE-associated domain